MGLVLMDTVKELNQKLFPLKVLTERVPFFAADVHDFHSHGSEGQETEPEPSREGAGERGHGQHHRPEGPRASQEGEEMLLRT